VTALLVGWSGPRGTIVAGLTLSVIWAGAAVLIATGVRDLDGFMDCWPGCTALQEVVGFAFFAGPAMLVVLLAGRLAAWLTRRV
jgi:hypothetical protein